jgi:hypothetical protein
MAVVAVEVLVVRVEMVVLAVAVLILLQHLILELVTPHLPHLLKVATVETAYITLVMQVVVAGALITLVETQQLLLVVMVAMDKHHLFQVLQLLMLEEVVVEPMECHIQQALGVLVEAAMEE